MTQLIFNLGNYHDFELSKHNLTIRGYFIRIIQSLMLLGGTDSISTRCQTDISFLFYVAIKSILRI